MNLSVTPTISRNAVLCCPCPQFDTDVLLTDSWELRQALATVHQFLSDRGGGSGGGQGDSAVPRPDFGPLRNWGELALADIMRPWLRMLAAAAVPSGGSMEQLLSYLSAQPSAAEAAGDEPALSAAQQAVLHLLTVPQQLQLCQVLGVASAGAAAQVLVGFTAAALQEGRQQVGGGVNVVHMASMQVLWAEQPALGVSAVCGILRLAVCSCE